MPPKDLKTKHSSGPLKKDSTGRGLNTHALDGYIHIGSLNLEADNKNVWFIS
jgi:hypothetical protein